MKKSLFFAALAVTALCGCSSDSYDVALENEQQTDDLVPVQLGVGRGTASVIQTRGTGTVGSTDENDNAWHSEALRVLMMQIPDQTHSGYDYTNFGGEHLGYLFNNTFICRPTDAVAPANSGATGLDYLTYTNGAMRYYPMTGYSEFFAYHIDDAGLDENGELINISVTDAYGNPTKNPKDSIDEVAKTVTVPFIIDGSQDLMAGKATNYRNGERGFSAASARAGVVPNIEMQHLLTRLEFAVRAGNTKASTVTIDALKIVSVKSGKIIAAYDEAGVKAPGDLIEWSTDAADVDSFVLKYRKDNWYSEGKKELLKDTATLFKFSSIPDMTNAVANKVAYPLGNGAALFVQPNVNSYDLALFVSHAIQTENGIEIEHNKVNLTVKLDNAGTLPFLVGNSYHVDIVVYGYNEIAVEATLIPWTEAESILIDTADPENPVPSNSDLMKLSNLTLTSGTTMNLDMNGIAAGTIAYTTSSIGAVTFESSDPSVATVDGSGNVTAVGVGTATITVSQAADDDYCAGSKAVTVTVVDSTPIPLADSDLTITSGATMDLFLNGIATGTITYSTSSTGAVTFESSDPSVATVDDSGNVTSVGVGTATITVSQAADDTYNAGNKTVTVNVDVE